MGATAWKPTVQPSIWQGTIEFLTSLISTHSKCLLLIVCFYQSDSSCAALKVQRGPKFLTVAPDLQPSIASIVDSYRLSVHV